jgi:peptidylprolyl isomerase
MPQAKNGDKVKLHYTGTLHDGTEFDTSVGGDPIEFTLGEGQLIPGFEKAVVGMSPGDQKKFTIPSDEAYGPRREELLVTVDRSQMPDDVDPTVGDNLLLERDDQQFPVRVVETSDDTVTLDANHPLAGEDLVFDIEVLEVA